VSKYVHPHAQDEFDTDPAEHLPAGLIHKLVLAPNTGYGKLQDAANMSGTFASLKDSAAWGLENMLCY